MSLEDRVKRLEKAHSERFSPGEYESCMERYMATGELPSDPGKADVIRCFAIDFSDPGNAWDRSIGGER